MVPSIHTVIRAWLFIPQGQCYMSRFTQLEIWSCIHLTIFEMSKNITPELMAVMLRKKLKQVERKYNNALKKAYLC